jgi:hypothetical protein
MQYCKQKSYSRNVIMNLIDRFCALIAFTVDIPIFGAIFRSDRCKSELIRAHGHLHSSVRHILRMWSTHQRLLLINVHYSKECLQVLALLNTSIFYTSSLPCFHL